MTNSKRRLQLAMEHPLVRWITERSMTIQEFADRLEVNRRTVYNWVNGFSTPHISLFPRIRSVLGFPRDTITEQFAAAWQEHHPGKVLRKGKARTRKQRTEARKRLEGASR